MSPSSAPAPQIRISPPRLFNTRALVVIIGYGLLLAFPALLLALVAVCVPKYGSLTYLLPLLALAAATVFLPFGFGNRCVSKLVRSLPPVSAPDDERFIVQVTLTPRLRSGLRAWIEDADDIGWLGLTETALKFEGDSVQLFIPLATIEQLQSRSSSWRGFFVCGQRIRIVVNGLDNIEALDFAERSSWWVPGSRKTAELIYRRIAERVQKKSTAG